MQTLRHAWGAKEIGYTASRLPDAPFIPSVALLIRVAHDNLLAGVGWVIMTLGAQLPILFHPALLHRWQTLPFILLQIALLTVSALTILFWLIDLRLRPPRITPWTWGERLYELASLPLLAILILGCVALPVLHAQTRLLLGKPLHFRVTLKS